MTCANRLVDIACYEIITFGTLAIQEIMDTWKVYGVYEDPEDSFQQVKMILLSVGFCAQFILAIFLFFGAKKRALSYIKLWIYLAPLSTIIFSSPYIYAGIVYFRIGILILIALFPMSLRILFIKMAWNYCEELSKENNHNDGNTVPLEMNKQEE